MSAPSFGRVVGRERGVEAAAHLRPRVGLRCGRLRVRAAQRHDHVERRADLVGEIDGVCALELTDDSIYWSASPCEL